MNWLLVLALVLKILEMQMWAESPTVEGGPCPYRNFSDRK